jgi:hypothetical protein
MSPGERAKPNSNRIPDGTRNCGEGAQIATVTASQTGMSAK